MWTFSLVAGLEVCEAADVEGLEVFGGDGFGFSSLCPTALFALAAVGLIILSRNESPDGFEEVVFGFFCGAELGGGPTLGLL